MPASSPWVWLISTPLVSGAEHLWQISTKVPTSYHESIVRVAQGHVSINRCDSAATRCWTRWLLSKSVNVILMTSPSGQSSSSQWRIWPLTAIIANSQIGDSPLPWTTLITWKHAMTHRAHSNNLRTRWRRFQMINRNFVPSLGCVWTMTISMLSTSSKAYLNSETRPLSKRSKRIRSSQRKTHHITTRMSRLS